MSKIKVVRTKSNIIIKCLNCGADFRIYPFEVGKRKFCSTKCNGSYYAEQYSRERIGSGNPMFNKKPWNYNGGNQRKYDHKYKVWRESIIKRDQAKCRGCGKTTTGSDCIVHHILPYKEFPNERFKKNNGITLCRSCHNKFDEGIKKTQF